MPQRLPINRRNEGLNIMYTKLNIDFFHNNRIDRLHNSNDLFLLPYFPGAKYRSKEDAITDVIVIVKSSQLDEAVIILYGTVLIERIHGIEEAKDLWLLFDDCLELIKDQIEIENVRDTQGNLLIVPRNNYASYPLEGIIKKNW